jgi:hypothetical protein
MAGFNHTKHRIANGHTFWKLRYPEGYLCISSFFRYPALDGKKACTRYIGTAFAERETEGCG